MVTSMQEFTQLQRGSSITSLSHTAQRKHDGTQMRPQKRPHRIQPRKFTTFLDMFGVDEHTRFKTGKVGGARREARSRRGMVGHIIFSYKHRQHVLKMSIESYPDVTADKDLASIRSLHAFEVHCTCFPACHSQMRQPR